MAYIGKTPVIGNFQKCDAIATVNGQAAYTMQVGSTNISPQSENHMIVSLNGIIQSPVDSFTVSGSTITFASNLVTGDVIDFIMILGNVLDLGVPSDNTVSLAKLTATGTKDATTFLRGDNTFDTPPLGGITEADLWRVPSSFTGAASPISSWERADDATSGYLGTGMTESSGTFTFPSTGIWRVSFTHSIYVNADERNAATTTRVSSNSGSSYDGVAETHLFGQQTSSNLTHNLGTSTAIIDVTDASTFRVKFDTNPQNSNTATFGQSDANQTFAEFIRLGDT